MQRMRRKMGLIPPLGWAERIESYEGEAITGRRTQ